MDLKTIDKKLKKELGTHRYTHTQGVMYTAAALAMAHSDDEELMHNAMLGGLLHDCAKGLPTDEQLEYAKKYDIELSKAEKQMPHLIHAKLGAYFAKKLYKVENEQVLHAI